MSQVFLVGKARNVRFCIKQLKFLAFVYNVVKISDQELAVIEFLVAKNESARNTHGLLRNVYLLFIYLSSIYHSFAKCLTLGQVNQSIR